MTRFGVLVLVLLTRLVREGLFVRALVWPGLLTGTALVGTALVMGVLKGAPTVAVDDERWVEPLEEAGFAPEVVADPERAFRRAQYDKAVRRAGDGAVMYVHAGGSDTRNLESALRNTLQATWRRTAQPPPPPPDVREPTRQIAALVSILFTLYGVVMGAAVVYRDRQEGVLEAELSLPLPFWMHGLARLVAATVGLVLALVVTLLLMDGLMGIHQMGPWLVTGIAGAIAGASIGLTAMSFGRGDFSSPLSRSLLLSMTLLMFGGTIGPVGHTLPIASIGGLFRGHIPGPMPLVLALLSVGVATVAFGRRGLQA